MKKVSVLCVMLVVLFSAVVFAEKGPMPDKVYFDVRMQQEVAVRDVAAGNLDIYMNSVPASIMNSLPQSILNNLEVYSVPSGSWSLLFNPVPNEPPYTVKIGNKEYFNPLAIQEVRFAMNFLINRQYIVDEIQQGAGGPMFTVATPGQPGTQPYIEIAANMGLTPEGNQELALEMIEEAMTKAANLPENRGRLIKQGQWWTFDGEPVTLKFLIRVDDPEGRLKSGRYIADQIEKAGIKVERLERDRSAITTAYYSNPADLEWHIYTEGWGAGATRKYWHHIVSQMYAPWYANMPGGGDPAHWNYVHEEIDNLTLKVYSGNFSTEEEYWDAILRATELGLEDSVRIYISYQQDYYVANKNNYNRRVVYGLGDGLNQWSIITSDTKNRELRVTQYSAQGVLFMSAWDPVGTNGFNDTFSINIASTMYDYGMFESPASADITPAKIIPRLDTLDTKFELGEDGELVGLIEVPEDAIKFDPFTKQWVNVGPGLTSISVCTYDIVYGVWNNGVSESLADYMFGPAYAWDLSVDSGSGDTRYDPTYSTSMMPTLEVEVARKLNPDGSITVWFNYNFPVDHMYLASWGAPWWNVSASNQPVGVSWEIVEALTRLVEKGGASGRQYTFSATSAGGNVYEVDVIEPVCVGDIKVELQKMIDEKYVPVYIKDYVTPEEAVERYRTSLNFINKHNHAYIGNGPFLMERYDPVGRFVELTAVRDERYPFERGYWNEYFETTRLNIDGIDLAFAALAAIDLPVYIHVSEVLYPYDTATPAEGGNVEVALIALGNKWTFKAEPEAAGLFLATIPSSVLMTLEPGTYSVVVTATSEGAIPSTYSTSIIVY
ncbi:ABC transporter substrate-binding protein [Petrotoga sp. 9PWA.NaAc.5.4]|uniref:ABC transporter substrate-binding protein n=1 Tax=Petrotoga sp. 9PWA.NaAc.5.4 TaxID=1434328 RepID=UPI000CC8B85C|nr:ABC transporter substrate-binding protein [Petrotoga sp. 9PWA.NaAc.5.4]PNR95766.1 ABC transporter substrate-binding protein [Petrotoga sp. 9PWA.NaAc.5.4]